MSRSYYNTEILLPLCGGQGVPCHTISPHRVDTSSNQASKDPGYLSRGYSNLCKSSYISNVIPEAANFVNAERVAGLARTLPEDSVSRHPPSSKMWQPAHFRLLAACQLCTAGFSFPAFHFWLFPQTVCALLERLRFLP